MTVRFLTMLAVALAAPLMPLAAQAAPPSPAGALPIPVVLLPSSGESGAPASALRWLDDAVRAGLPRAGLAALAGSPFLLDVRVTSRELGRSEAGMQNVILAESAVTLDLRSASAVFTVGSARLTARGNGRTTERAIEGSISAVAKDAKGLERALSELVGQAVTAYESSCDMVLAAAREQAQARAFDEAIAISMTVPSAATKCRPRAEALATTLYGQRSQYLCGTALQRARAARAAGDLVGAMDEIVAADPMSPCAAQVERFIAEVAKEAAAQRAKDAEERAQVRQQEMQLAREAIRAYSSIEQQRLAVLGEIAKAALRHHH